MASLQQRVDGSPNLAIGHAGQLLPYCVGKPGAVEGRATNGFEGNALDVGCTRKGLRLLEDWNGIGLVEDIVLRIAGRAGEALFTIGLRGEARPRMALSLSSTKSSPCRSTALLRAERPRFFG